REEAAPRRWLGVSVAMQTVAAIQHAREDRRALHRGRHRAVPAAGCGRRKHRLLAMDWAANARKRLWPLQLPQDRNASAPRIVADSPRSNPRRLARLSSLRRSTLR